jgi:hypothetical protein
MPLLCDVPWPGGSCWGAPWQRVTPAPPALGPRISCPGQDIEHRHAAAPCAGLAPRHSLPAPLICFEFDWGGGLVG